MDGEFARSQSGNYAGDKQALSEIISLFQFDDVVELMIGDACQKIPEFRDANKHTLLSFAYLDFDLYEPTKIALEFIDECTSIGGVIVFDQACTQEWPGETLAMKEFLQSTQHNYDMISNTLSRQPTIGLVRKS